MRSRALATFLCCTLPLASQTLVSPPGYDQREGSSKSAYPFARTMRYQQFHPDLKGVARTFKALAFRRDGSLEQAAGTGTVTLTVGLGTCDFASVGTSFAGNWAERGTHVVSDRNVSMPDWSPLPNTIPAPFTLYVPFDSHFAFAGTKSLLLEMLVTTASADGRYADAARNTDSETYGRIEKLGTGCSSPGGAFTLAGSVWSDTQDQRCHTTWEMTGGPSNATCALLLGGADPYAAIPGLCGAGRLRTDALASVGFTSSNAGTHAAIGLSAPYAPTLLGRSLTGQLVASDPTQGALPFAVSNGLRQTIPMHGGNTYLGRLYALGSVTAGFGTLDLTSQLVTRFTY